MALQFVLGSSGSGKTEYIYERLVRQAGEHPKKNYLVIVPEQFTMQTQQKLVELAPNHAIMNIDVLSFWHTVCLMIWGCRTYRFWKKPEKTWCCAGLHRNRRRRLPFFGQI